VRLDCRGVEGAGQLGRGEKQKLEKQKVSFCLKPSGKRGSFLITHSYRRNERGWEGKLLAFGGEGGGKGGGENFLLGILGASLRELNYQKA